MTTQDRISSLERQLDEARETDRVERWIVLQRKMMYVVQPDYIVVPDEFYESLVRYVESRNGFLGESAIATDAGITFHRVKVAPSSKVTCG